MTDILNGKEVFVGDGIFTGDVYAQNGNIYAGAEGAQEGCLVLYGAPTGSTQGGKIIIHTADDYDATYPSYTIDVSSDELSLIANRVSGGDKTLLRYDGSAIYISEGTESGIGGGGTVVVGRLDGLVSDGNATIWVAGGSSGNNTGGAIFLLTSADNDDPISSYKITVSSDDLIIGPSTDTDSLKYSGDTGLWAFTAGKVGVGVDENTQGVLHLFGDNDDAGGILRLYPGANYNDGIDSYFIEGRGGPNDGSGDSLVFGKDSTDLMYLIYDGDYDMFQFLGAYANFGTLDSIPGFITVYAGGEGSNTGGSLALQTPADYDTLVSQFTFAVFQDELRISGYGRALTISDYGGVTLSLGGHDAGSADVGYPSANGDTRGIKDYLETSSGVTAYDLLYYDGSYYETADATDDTKAPVRAMTLATDSNIFEGFRYGYIYNDAWNWTPGAELFLAVGGGFTETAPSASGNIVQYLGYAVTADLVFFEPSKEWYEV